MTSVEYGNLDPRLVIQEDARACLSACILSQLPEASGTTERDVSEVLIRDGLYREGIGTELFPANTLDVSLQKLGLAASPVFDARLASDDEKQLISERLAGIEKAVRGGQNVILAFPKRREGQEPFLHYGVVSGFSETDKGVSIALLDPSDVDGGVHHIGVDELAEYVTPEGHVPVMAWGVSEASGAQTRLAKQVSEQGLPGFSLLAKPHYDTNSVGEPIPTGTEHPSSVSIPTASISGQFNRLGGVVLSRDGQEPVGYPRFVVPPAVRELSRVSVGGLGSLPFPSRQSAEAATHLEKTYTHIHGDKMNADIVEDEGLYWLADTNFNIDAWQRTGLGISSRQAQATLEGRPDNDLARREVAEQEIKTVIETHTGAKPEDIYLFSTGMAAIYWLNQALIKASDGLPAVQFGFPYTDTYDQRMFGPERGVSKNVIDFRQPDYQRLQDLVDSGQRLRGVMTEYPSNPLLWTPNFERLEHSLDGNTPIIVDDTIGTMFNLDDSKLPNSVAARVTSLTKFFSSVGDVMGGSIVLRPESPHYDQLKAAIDELYEDTIWYEDAEVLASNSQLFPNVMSTINSNGGELTEWLSDEWVGEGKALEAVYYPGQNGKREYDAVKKAEGGYGGLFTLRFNDPERAYRFFDALRVNKGPSLGTYYTLGCLYTPLAHKMMDMVEKFGVTPDLVRISTGIENIDDLKARFVEAFEASARD